ncbi:Uncharacterised protein [Mycobacteroides abscessus]|nr:Uncharacterised protein [Mycobacteroides abscessus]
MATVLSTISGTPTSCATAATASMSRTSACGFGIVSPKNSFVFGRTASRQACGSCGSATNVVSTPSLASEYCRRL